MIQNILRVGKSGMSSTQNSVDLISSNITNANTTGYKKLDSEFQTLVNYSLDRDSYPNNSPDSITGVGIKSSNTYRNTAQGSLRLTEIPSNIAIDGEGYFRVLRQDGTFAYTRNGEFNVDASGRLVSDDGYLLDVQFLNGMSYENINLGEQNYAITTSGEFLVDGELIGKINLYKSIGENDLLSIRDNLFVPKNGVNMVQSNTANLYQNYTEMSNVDISEEMTNLIMMTRAYQLNTKGISVADEMWSLINGM